jgi:hypothetical protein
MTMLFLRVMALCGLLALAGCETTAWDDETSPGPARFPCASITNPRPDYGKVAVQRRDQLEAQPQQMCGG